MQRTRWFPPLIAAATIALSALACNIPSPTPVLPPDTITPYAPGSSTAVPTTGPTAVGAPTEPPGAPTVPPGAPTEPPPLSWLPAGTIALYTSGTWESGQLYALTPGPTSVDLGHTVGRTAAISLDGRWLAHGSGSPVSSVTATSLETSATYVIPLTANFTLYGLAFDQAESRLAFMELGGSGAGSYTWAIVVVNLADGSTTRFETTMTLGTDPPILPGRPLGWSASGDEILLTTFMPDTEGNWAGLWAVLLPPGAAPAALDSLARRELIAIGDYASDPRLSRDGTRLLYLNRDSGYTPAGYTPMGYDLAVNQLWQVDIATGAQTQLVNAIDGSALARDAAWSQELPQALFAQGNYGGDTFASLMLKTSDAGGTVSDFGPAPLPAGGYLNGIDWCRPDFALVTVADASYDEQLHVVEIGGANTLITSAQSIRVLRCVQ